MKNCSENMALQEIIEFRCDHLMFANVTGDPIDDNFQNSRKKIEFPLLFVVIGFRIHFIISKNLTVLSIFLCTWFQMRMNAFNDVVICSIHFVQYSNHLRIDSNRLTFHNLISIFKDFFLLK